ncbi:MAG: AraC family transcriptional regulator [Pedobacter sp.]|nr:MAG: AraC family transcriptional regulator [Pedobacter sp.]
MTASEILITQKEKEIERNLTLTFINHEAQTQPLIKNLNFSKFLLRNFLAEETGLNPTRITADQNVFLIQFCIAGNSTVKNSAQKKVASFKQAAYNIIFLPKGESLTIINSGDFELVHIYLSTDFFSRYTPEDYNFPNSVSTSSKMFPKNLYLSPKLKHILNEITLCDFSGNLKNLYTKAKIIELLALQLAQYEEEKLVPSTLKSSEAEKMMLVKEMIENNLNEPQTISSLARAAGTNEQYLKQHFKILFGNTVFGHMLACKMEKSKEMLLTGKYRITEIAEMVGYKHATHFTSAFKKFFGCLPQSFKTKLFFGGYFSFNLEALEILMMI